MKVDYSDLVDALQQQDQIEIREHLRELHPRLCTYLQVTMDASPENAEDAVQEALTETYHKLREGKIKAKKYFFKYLLQACRNEYLMLMRYKDRAEITDELDASPKYLVAPSMQFTRLLDEERKTMLEECIEGMKENYKKFVYYYCKQSKWNPQAAADHFNITNANARKMKSRAIKRLAKCVNDKLKR